MIGSKSNNHKKIKRFYTLNSDWNIINEQGLFCELGGGMDAISLSTISSYDILQFSGDICNCRGVASWGAGGTEPPRTLADQLTLFKPGGQIMPLTLLPAPSDSKSYLHLCNCKFHNWIRVFLNSHQNSSHYKAI